MKAMQIDNYGGAEVLHPSDMPVPAPAQGQVVVTVHAASYNPIDAKMASGMMRQIMPLSFPWTPGNDFSGVIEAVGEGVGGFQVGDAVYGAAPAGGAYAEKITVSTDLIARKPRSLSHVEAASLGLVAQTASQALDAANLQSGQTILIHGASGGVGCAAVQLAHARGARVIATASQDTADLLTSLGADQVIDYKTTAFETVVSNVDVVLDGVGGDTQQRSFGVLKPGGCLVALSQPPSPEEATKHQVRAVMLQTQPSGDNLRAIAEKVEAGEIKPTVGKVYPLSEVATVWQQAASLHIPGKIVFTIA